MPPVACGKCGLKMSSDAAVCPHCGARAEGAPTKLADVKFSPAELRAIVAAEDAARGAGAEPKGVVSTLLVPHPRTSGGARVAELVLTAVALPLILAGLLPLMGIRRVTRGRVTDVAGEAATVLTVSVSGGVGLASILAETALSGGQIVLVVLGEIAVLIARSVVRDRASASYDLMRLHKGD